MGPGGVGRESLKAERVRFEEKWELMDANKGDVEEAHEEVARVSAELDARTKRVAEELVEEMVFINIDEVAEAHDDNNEIEYEDANDTYYEDVIRKHLESANVNEI